MDWDKFKRAIASCNHVEYEIILRKKPSYNVEQMRKYFHGPVRSFIKKELNNYGQVLDVNEIKEDLKEKFGPKVDHKTLFGVVIQVPKSMAHYTRDEYKQFLKDISDWCKDALHCDLPASEEVE